MGSEIKIARIDQETTFCFFLCFFFLKIQDIRKSKIPIFEKGLHQLFLDQVLTIFQTAASLMSRFANGNILSTPSCFIRQCKMNIQNFCLFVFFARAVMLGSI